MNHVPLSNDNNKNILHVLGIIGDTMINKKITFIESVMINIVYITDDDDIINPFSIVSELDVDTDIKLDDQEEDTKEG